MAQMDVHAVILDLPMVEYLRLRRDVFIQEWGLWRDAQAFDDSSKEIVDKAFNEYIRTLDNLINTLV